MNYLSCPKCQGILKRYENDLTCQDCSESYTIVEGVYDFLDDDENNKHEMHSFFDRAAPYYESTEYYTFLYRFYGGLDVPPTTALVNYVNSIFREDINHYLEPADGQILDVACGTGMYTRSIARLAFHVHGADMSPDMLKTAKKYSNEMDIDNVTFLRARAEKLPFPDEIFDGVACCGALQLLKDVEIALNEIYRVLKPEGKFAGLTYIQRRKLADESLIEYLEQEQQIHIFKVDEIEKKITEAGFSNFKYQIYGSIIIFGVEK